MKSKLHQPKNSIVNLVQIIQFLNSIFLMVSAILILWIWFNLMTDDGINMFLGLVGLPLFIATIYYLTLIIWGLKLFIDRQNNSIELRPAQSIIILFMIVLPLVIIYYLTT